MTQSVRHAEKQRVSTCSFADRIAQVSIQAYRQLCQSSTDQTVLATFVLFDQSHDEFHVVALGVGTKFMSAADIAADRKGLCVRDSHAEVLARRALRRFFLLQLLRLLQWRPTATDNCATGAIEARLAERSCLLPQFLELVPEKQHVRLKAQYRLHMYSSAQPCGNAVIKRWAKGAKEVFFERIPSNEVPLQPHSKITIHARHEGQVALLVKRDGRGSDGPAGQMTQQSASPQAGAALATVGRLGRGASSEQIGTQGQRSRDEQLASNSHVTGGIMHGGSQVRQHSVIALGCQQGMAAAAENERATMLGNGHGQHDSNQRLPFKEKSALGARSDAERGINTG